MIEMSVEFVRVSMQNYNRVVILKEKESERYLLIWIGPPKRKRSPCASATSQPPRPQTHDLLRNIIESLEAQVSYVLVNDLNNDTFYARIVLDQNGRQVEIDSRTSDAIALAVRAQVPIYAEESVLDRAGILLDHEHEDVVTAIVEHRRSRSPGAGRAGRAREDVRLQGLHRVPRPRRLRKAQAVTLASRSAGAHAGPSPCSG